MFEAADEPGFVPVTAGSDQVWRADGPRLGQGRGKNNESGAIRPQVRAILEWPAIPTRSLNSFMRRFLVVSMRQPHSRAAIPQDLGP